MSTAERPTLAERHSLAGRVAVVTGGAGLLGSVLAGALAEQGASVVVVDRDEADCHRAVAGLADLRGAEHRALGIDLTEPEAADAVVGIAESAYGQLDVLVNNAAFTGSSGVPGYAAPFEEQTAEAFLAAVRLNLLAPFLLTQRATSLLRASGHGSVVNISSIYGLVGPNMNLYTGTSMGNPAAYAATKGGLIQLTRYLATVLAPDIRVNAVAPGGIARGQDPQFTQRYEALTPLRRMATEDDVRGAVCWLVSDAASYVTGQVVAIDGGWSAW